MSMLYQYSHFWAVTNGCYDGELTIGELKQFGDTGLGTFNALNGELIVVDNVFFHCTGGKARLARDEEKLPWAAVMQFNPSGSADIANVKNMAQLSAWLQKLFPQHNYPVALTITATVNNIALGSVPKQERPYRSIASIIEDSILLDTGKLNVQISGFYTPAFMHPIKSEGIHLHFIDEARKFAGHVLDLDLQVGTISWEVIESVNLIFPRLKAYQETCLKMDLPTEGLPVFSDRLHLKTFQEGNDEKKHSKNFTDGF